MYLIGFKLSKKFANSVISAFVNCGFSQKHYEMLNLAFINILIFNHGSFFFKYRNDSFRHKKKRSDLKSERF